MEDIQTFFNRLASFDTETTGLNVYRSKTDPSKAPDRIWQIGFYRATGESTQEVINPFYDDSGSIYVPEGLEPTEFQSRMKNSLGKVSQKWFEQGVYDELFEKHASGTLNTDLTNLLEEVLEKNIQKSDVLILQNHQFENRLLKAGAQDGIINSETYERLESRFSAIQNNTSSPKGLLQRNFDVVKASNESLITYRTELVGSPTEGRERVIENYTKAMNRVIDAYSNHITKGEVGKGAVVVEQIDVTRALYANAINAGLMDYRHAQIGLSIDFLSQSLLGRAETHTALQDSKDTIEVFKKTWSMIAELRSNHISDSTKAALLDINERQFKEIHPQFLSSVESTLSELSREGVTRYRPDDKINIIGENIQDKLSTTGGGVIDDIITTQFRSTSNVEEALDLVESHYQYHGNADIRADYINKIKESYRTSGVNTAYQQAMDATASYQRGENQIPVDKTEVFKAATNATKSVEPSEAASLFGVKMSKTAKRGIIGAGLLLGGMFMTTKPEPKTEDTDNVATNFYNEQYLGTEFVNFNNRNKHYMY